MQTDDAQQFYPADLPVPGRMYVPHAGIFICLLTCPACEFREGSKWFSRNATSVRYSHASTRDGALT
jgi:hypothetical protein